MTRKLLRKAQASIPKILIGLLIVAVFMVGWSSMLNDFDTQYDGVNKSDELQGRLDNFSQAYDSTQNLAVDVQNRTSGTQASQDVDVGISLENAIKALNLVWDSFGIATTMVETVTSYLGIDAIYMWAVIGTLIITVTFIFLSAVLKNPL